jgi:hypothetical protein
MMELWRRELRDGGTLAEGTLKGLGHGGKGFEGLKAGVFGSLSLQG